MIALLLLAVALIEAGVIVYLVLRLRKQPEVISMSEIAYLAAELSSKTGVGYDTALRSLMGVKNYGARYTK